MAGYGQDRRSMMTMGCDYRARTGACSCPNPPYGCRTGSNAVSQNDGGFKICFPKGVNSYRELRMGSKGSSGVMPTEHRVKTSMEETEYNDEGIPVGFSKSASKGMAFSKSSVPCPTKPPPPLPKEFKLLGSPKPLPAVGWQCTASDAAEAVSLGIQYLDVSGDPAAESALGSAMRSLRDEQRRRLTVATAVKVDTAEAIAPAVQAASERLGVEVVDLVCLICDDMEESLLESAWMQMGALVDKGKAVLVGLHCRDVVKANLAFSKAIAVSDVSGGAKVAVLQMPMHPMIPKLQRMLLGVCRRNRCQMVSLDPLGGVEHAKSIMQCKEVKCTQDADAAEVLFAYNLGRGVAVLPSSKEGGTLQMALSAKRPLVAEHRLALDLLAPQA